jgi:NADH:ubiquinone oxidoreductase subunit F (NADH-binding)
MIVADESTCMVDIARYFLSFTQAESCGKCLPCRVGTRKLLHILTAITHGQGSLADLERLEQLCATVGKPSLCGLGQTAPNPVLTTLRYVGEDYRAHVVDKRCPAGSCALG